MIAKSPLNQEEQDKALALNKESTVKAKRARSSTKAKATPEQASEIVHVVATSSAIETSKSFEATAVEAKTTTNKAKRARSSTKAKAALEQASETVQVADTHSAIESSNSFEASVVETEATTTKAKRARSSTKAKAALEQASETVQVADTPSAIESSKSVEASVVEAKTTTTTKTKRVRSSTKAKAAPEQASETLQTASSDSTQVVDSSSAIDSSNSFEASEVETKTTTKAKRARSSTKAKATPEQASETIHVVDSSSAIDSSNSFEASEVETKTTTKAKRARSSTKAKATPEQASETIHVADTPSAIESSNSFEVSEVETKTTTKAKHARSSTKAKAAPEQVVATSSAIESSKSVEATAVETKVTTTKAKRARSSIKAKAAPEQASETVQVVDTPSAIESSKSFEATAVETKATTKAKRARSSTKAKAVPEQASETVQAADTPSAIESSNSVEASEVETKATTTKAKRARSSTKAKATPEQASEPLQAASSDSEQLVDSSSAIESSKSVEATAVETKTTTKAKRARSSTKAKSALAGSKSKEAGDTFDCEVMLAHAREALDFDHPVLLVPIRHHSLAMGLHLQRIIEAYQPDCIALELPYDCQEQVKFLSYSGVEPPIGFFSYGTIKAPLQNDVASLEAQDNVLSFRHIYPMLSYSPEYIALKTALAHSVVYKCIDVGYGERAYLEHLYPDSSLETDACFDALAKSSAYENCEEFWDKHFEINALVQDTHSYLENLYLYCYSLRKSMNESADSVLVQRELFMLKNINALKKHYHKILVLTGGLHTVALCDYLYFKKSKAQALKFPKAKSSCFITPYSFKANDEHSQYSAGVIFPNYYLQLYKALSKSLVFTPGGDKPKFLGNPLSALETQHEQSYLFHFREHAAKALMDLGSVSEQATLKDLGASLRAKVGNYEAIKPAYQGISQQERAALLKFAVAQEQVQQVIEATNLFFVNKLDHSKQRINTALQIDCQVMSKGLAVLRSKIAPSVFELIDATKSAFVKEELTSDNYLLLKLFERLTSVPLGTVPISANVPPIWRDFVTKAKAFGLKTDDGQVHQAHVNIFKDDKNIQKGRFLAQVSFLSPKCFVQNSSDSNFNYVKRTETYSYCYNSSVVGDLVLASELGGDLPSACEGKLSLEIAKKSLTLVELCLLLKSCVDMGIESKFALLRQNIVATVLKERDLLTIEQALNILHSYDFAAKSNQHNLQIIKDLIYLVLKRSLDILSDHLAVVDSELDSFLSALQSINYYFMKYQDLYEDYCALLSDLLLDENISATVQGAYVSLLFKNKHISYSDFERQVNQFVCGAILRNNDCLGFFYAVLAIARSGIFYRNGILQLLNSYLTSLQGEEFLKVLVMLRRSFAYFNQEEKSKVISLLEKILGLKVEQLKFTASAKEFVANRQADSAMVAALEQWLPLRLSKEQ